MFRFRRRWWTGASSSQETISSIWVQPSDTAHSQLEVESLGHDAHLLAAELETLVRRELTEQGLDELFQGQVRRRERDPGNGSAQNDISSFSEPSEARAGLIGSGPLSWQAHLLEVDETSHQRPAETVDEQEASASEWTRSFLTGLYRLKGKLRDGDAESWERLKHMILERATWFLREQAEQQLRWKAMRQDPSYVVEDFTANQRTFFSWIRTSFRMVLTGAAVGKLLKGTPVIVLGVLYAALGLVYIALGTMHFYHWQRTLYDHRYLRDSRPFFIVFLGITATCVAGFVACWI